MSALHALLRREWQLVLRRPLDILTPLGFFVMVTSLFPLGIGPDPALLTRVAPGILWVAALLATLLGLPRLFAEDHADGSLEQLALSPTPLVLLVSAKIGMHWLTCSLPLVLLSPLIGLQFDLPINVLGDLVLALLPGTLVLSLIGAIGSALTLGVRGGSVLLALLVLPLYVPTLVFGSAAVEAALAGQPTGAHLSLLYALLCASAALAPWATTAALRLALESA